MEVEKREIEGDERMKGKRMMSEVEGKMIAMVWRVSVV